jgi:hypothetical protein
VVEALGAEHVAQFGGDDDNAQTGQYIHDKLPDDQSAVDLSIKYCQY